jgi:hypothetical protein
VKDKKTSHQAADIQERRNVLRRRIEAWKAVQVFYMPAVSELQDSSPSDPSTTNHPEKIPLRLPSSVPSDQRDIRCLEGISDKECCLRVAQVNDALLELQRLLRVKMGLWNYKRTQVGASQHALTRTQHIISRFMDKIDRCVKRYCAARNALLSLDPSGDWTSRFLELKPEHVRHPQQDEDQEVRFGEGHREISWIWMVKTDRADVSGLEGSNDELNDCQ